jgi:hypothetical protein
VNEKVNPTLIPREVASRTARPRRAAS